MSPDAELLVIFGVLHLVALVLGGALFLMFLRSDGASTWTPDDEDDSGGGGNDRVSDKPKTSPSGGIPLPVRRPVGHAPALRARQARRPGPPARADAQAAPSRAPAARASRYAADSGSELRRRRERALDVGPGRLAHAVVGDEPLLVDRRVGRGLPPSQPGRTQNSFSAQ